MDHALIGSFLEAHVESSICCKRNPPAGSSRVVFESTKVGLAEQYW